ncbi:MADF domain-containing protein [Nephila pilipes]|uniref:MADF domain-containing protein n=1 Tax=Nephila pilipes TaxID=299642 RepID=A0A8X6TUF5_NEPPI|nr:MADF domain-containing protein [Nephila pilipes]
MLNLIRYSYRGDEIFLRNLHGLLLNRIESYSLVAREIVYVFKVSDGIYDLFRECCILKRENMVTEAGKELLRNTIYTAKFHNRILEENEMWKQWELECGLTMMVSDDDILKKIKKNHQCSKHRKRDRSRERSTDRFRDKRRIEAKPESSAGSSNDRWDHSGFKELYPDAVVSPKKSSSHDHSNKLKKKKKKHRRSPTSDDEILEDFKRVKRKWTEERVRKLIKLLNTAPALWDIKCEEYYNRHIKRKEAKRIASYFHTSKNSIFKKIKLLEIRFYKEHEKKIMSEWNSEVSSKKEWFGYRLMKFIIETDKCVASHISKENTNKDNNSYDISLMNVETTTGRYSLTRHRSGKKHMLAANKNFQKNSD